MADPANQMAIRALANPTRRRIVELLRDGELSVGALVDRFDVARPAISRHLRVLREAGLVGFRTDHNARYYSVDAGEMERLRRDFDAEFRDFWRPQGSEDESETSGVVSTDLGRAYEVTVSASLPVPASQAYRYVTEEELFTAWVGADARSTPEVGGTISASSAFGGRLVAEFLAMQPDRLLVLRILEPLDPDANLYTIEFEPEGERVTRVTLRHFVRDENIARLIRMAWRETWKLLHAFAEKESGEA